MSSSNNRFFDDRATVTKLLPSGLALVRAHSVKNVLRISPNGWRGAVERDGGKFEIDKPLGAYPILEVGMSLLVTTELFKGLGCKSEVMFWSPAPDSGNTLYRLLLVCVWREGAGRGIAQLCPRSMDEEMLDSVPDRRVPGSSVFLLSQQALIKRGKLVGWVGCKDPRLAEAPPKGYFRILVADVRGFGTSQELSEECPLSQDKELLYDIPEGDGMIIVQRRVGAGRRGIWVVCSDCRTAETSVQVEQRRDPARAHSTHAQVSS